MRDAHVAEREKDILEREATVLAREQAVLSRENAVRSAQEAVKDNESKLAAAWSAHRSQVAQQQMQQMQLQERENVRPVEPEVIARVASRPSMVPRRPLGDDRRARCVLLTLPSFVEAPPNRLFLAQQHRQRHLLPPSLILFLPHVSRRHPYKASPSLTLPPPPARFEINVRPLGRERRWGS